MNIKLVESLAQVVQSLAPEVGSLLEEKLKTHQEQTSWAKAFREWAESHPRDRPSLSARSINTNKSGCCGKSKKCLINFLRLFKLI